MFGESGSQGDWRTCEADKLGPTTARLAELMTIQHLKHKGNG